MEQKFFIKLSPEDGNITEYLPTTERKVRETEKCHQNVKEEEPEIEQKEFDSYAFSSVVQYTYNFEEVAYLVYKLYQLIERKFKLKQRPRRDLQRFVEKWKKKRSDARESEPRMKFILEIEKIMKEAGNAVSAAQARSCAVKKRWRSLLDNIPTASQPESESDDLGGLVKRIVLST